MVCRVGFALPALWQSNGVFRAKLKPGCLLAGRLLAFRRGPVVELSLMNNTAFLWTLIGALLVSGPSLSQSPSAARMQVLQSAFHSAHPSARLDRAGAEHPLAHASRLHIYVEGENPIERSRTFLERWSGIFGLEDLELVHRKTVTMKARTTVRFDLRLEGLPIVGRQVVVTFDGQGALLRVTSDVLAVSRVASRLIERDAALIQAERLVGVSSRDRLAVSEAIQLDHRGAYRVWLVELPGQTAVIDGRDGSLRTIRKAVHP